jgi:anti-anti-sigma factor
MSSDSHPSHELADREHFRCEVSRDRDRVRLRVLGDLDLATVGILQARFAELRGDGVRQVTLDLSALAFMDSTGLRCVLDRDAEARQDGVTLALIPGPPAVQRVFEVTGTVTRLPFVDD